MVGVLVVTHGELADGFKSSVNLIMGNEDSFDTLGLYEGNDFDKFKESIYQKVVELDKGNGVIVFVDLLGASPYNATAMNMTQLVSEKHDVHLISGANLPMIIETLSNRTQGKSIEDLVNIALDAGKDSIEELKMKEN